MAYPFPSPAAGRKDIPAGPGKLWKSISQERRLEAAAAFWQDENEFKQQWNSLFRILIELKA